MTSGTPSETENLVHEQVAGAVVELALLGRQRAQPRQGVKPLHHLGHAEDAAGDEPLDVVAVADLPVELGVVVGGAEVVEDPLDVVGGGHATQPDGRDLGERDEHRGAVLLARHLHELEPLPGDVLLLEPGDPVDALLRVYDPVAGLQIDGRRDVAGRLGDLFLLLRALSLARRSHGSHRYHAAPGAATPGRLTEPGREASAGTGSSVACRPRTPGGGRRCPSRAGTRRIPGRGGRS